MKDIAIEEIREVRHNISAECGHDLDKFFSLMQEEQKKFRDQIDRYHELDQQNTQSMILNDKPKDHSQ